MRNIRYHTHRHHIQTQTDTTTLIQFVTILQKIQKENFIIFKFVESNNNERNI